LRVWWHCSILKSPLSSPHSQVANSTLKAMTSTNVYSQRDIPSSNLDFMDEFSSIPLPENSQLLFYACSIHEIWMILMQKLILMRINYTMDEIKL
jgi:hypothetical protein